MGSTDVPALAADLARAVELTMSISAGLLRGGMSDANL